MKDVSRWMAIALVLVPAACGGTAESVATPAAAARVEPSQPFVPAPAPTTPAPVTAAPPTVPSAPTTPTVPTPSSTDGVPTRTACTSEFGAGLTSSHGRLDGYVVSVVAAGTQGCNADNSHLHLQISANGGIYDAAVNLDTWIATPTLAVLPSGPWSEGWHEGDALDYPSDLGLHAADFTAPISNSARRADLESRLAAANHIALFATGYGPGGAHLVHREGNAADGAIILDPLSTHPTLIAFRFDNDAF